jgi:hypothetical protein
VVTDHLDFDLPESTCKVKGGSDVHVAVDVQVGVKLRVQANVERRAR